MSEKKTPPEEHEIVVQGARLTIPARPTVRQILRYNGTRSFVDPADYLIRGWAGVLKLMIQWESDLLPEPETDLDTITDPKAAEMISEIVLSVQRYLRDLDQEKN